VLDLVVVVDGEVLDLEVVVDRVVDLVVDVDLVLVVD
jgi:hypothetical protein